MIRTWIYICLVAVFSLTYGVIWPDLAGAVQAPQLERLGQIKAGLRVPTRIDVDAAGNLYVADSRLQQVVEFDKFGRQIAAFNAVAASGAGLAVNPAGSRVYVAAHDRVAVYAADTTLLGYLGKGADEFAAAGSIALDSDGNVYVADLKQHRIKIFNADLSYAGTLGSVTFVANSSMEIDSQDRIYLSEAAADQASGVVPRINVYDRAGNQLQSLSAETDLGSSPLLFFGGMTFDKSGRLYVGDVQGMSIRVLAPNGAALLDYNNNGQVSRPGCMVYDAVTNRLFVLRADSLVEIFGIDGGVTPVYANRAPSAPVPVSPIGGSEVTAVQPVLQFNNAVDADNDEVSYTVRLFDAAQRLIGSFDLLEQPAITSGAVSVSLQENSYYSWQVQAFDGKDVSPWSELQGFYVNAVEEAPSVPRLLAPLANQTVGTDSRLSWQASSDADPFDFVNYLVEVARDPAFNDLIISETVSTTDLALADYSAGLEPGRSYYWRVSAFDHYETSQPSVEDGRFSYQASSLVVTANMPGARVYLGGNLAYAGRFVGETPLDLRDLPVGRYQLVVERAGFEPYLEVVEVYADTSSTVYALLTPARQPAELSFAPLPVAGTQVAAAAQLNPLLADLDLDGVEDLLLADAAGTLNFYKGVLDNELALASGDSTTRQLTFSAGQPISIPQIPGAAPCLVDWNNDNLPDLLIGGADGSVRLFLNQGDFTFVGEGTWLTGVAGAAVPTVADIDQDGDKDLVLGSSDGELVLLANIGTDAAPQLGQPQTLITFADAAAPYFVDWDADGRRELLVAAEGQLYRAVYADGALGALSLVATAGGEPSRIIGHDLDGVNGKDLVAATADGQLLFAAAGGQSYQDSFYAALGDKLKQLQLAVAEEHPVHLSLVEMMLTSLADRNLGDVLVLTQELIFRLPADAAATVIASELAAILQ